MAKKSLIKLVICTVAAAFPLMAWAGPAPDSDGDGVPDVLDNCSDVPNAPPLDCDGDLDGFGNACDSDLDNNGATEPADFVAPGGFLEQFEAGVGDTADADCNGAVEPSDFVNGFLPAFQAGAAPGPSGLSCAGNPPCS